MTAGRLAPDERLAPVKALRPSAIPSFRHILLPKRAARHIFERRLKVNMVYLLILYTEHALLMPALPIDATYAYFGLPCGYYSRDDLYSSGIIVDFQGSISALPRLPDEKAGHFITPFLSLLIFARALLLFPRGQALPLCVLLVLSVTMAAA